MGDFAGGLLKYLRKNPLPKLTIAGGFGKLSKLAAGYLDLHSGRSQVDFDHLAALAGDIGATAELCQAIAAAETAMQALDLAEAASLPLADVVAQEARRIASDIAAAETEVEVLIFDREGQLCGRSHA
jgi:cobalt-precorrin-5B (C1)-methyltransferase